MSGQQLCESARAFIENPRDGRFSAMPLNEIEELGKHATRSACCVKALVEAHGHSKATQLAFTAGRYLNERTEASSRK